MLASLALVLQSSNNFELIAFFQVLFSLLLTVYEGLVQLTPSGSLFSAGFFWKVENNVSILFFVWNLQTVFPLKTMFSGGPSFSVIFVCNDGVLNLRLHVVALPASLTLSWPAKTTSKLNMSGLHFSVLVLQSSNSFDHMLFLKFCSVYCICEFEFFDSYKSNNVFLCSTF